MANNQRDIWGKGLVNIFSNYLANVIENQDEPARLKPPVQSYPIFQK